jgi:hypothetical protein
VNAYNNAPAGAKVTMPSRHCTDPKFKWRCAAATDVRRTWRKFRLLQRLQQGALA